MKRNLLTSFLIWVLTIQATLAFTPQASTKDVEQQKYIDQTLATYNAFASNPSKTSLPSHFSTEDNKAVREYMEKNKINGPLPGAKFIGPNTYEFSTKEKKIVVTIDPVHGIIRINGDTLILNSAGGLKGQLKQIEKFLTIPKTTSATINNSPLTKTVESFFSLFISSASADCLSKYDAAIVEQTPERKWYQSLPPEWPLAIIILAGLLLPPVAANIVAGTITVGLVGLAIEGAVHSEKYDRIETERKKKEETLAELVSIRGALAIAKSGKVPPEPETVKRYYNQDELRFFDLYFQYSNIVKKTGGVLLSKEEFLKALAAADKDEKLCSPTILETAEKVAAQITQQDSSLNPNEIIKNIGSLTEDKTAPTIDNQRRDAPKEVLDVGGQEQNNNLDTVMSK